MTIHRTLAVALALAAIALAGVACEVGETTGAQRSTAASAVADPAASTDAPAPTTEPEPAPTTAAPVTASPTTEQAFNGLRNGTWLVGDQIDPGLHRLYNTEPCYWARLSGFTGEFDDINANDNVTGYFIVDIQATDEGFELSCWGDGAEQVDGYPDGPLTPDSALVPSGVYEVGADITPGVYQLNGSCYWARLSGFTGEFDDIIANDNADGQFIVDIQATDAGFTLSCYG